MDLNDFEEAVRDYEKAVKMDKSRGSHIVLISNYYLVKRNVLTRRREYSTYLATARRHRRRLKMQKRDE